MFKPNETTTNMNLILTVEKMFKISNKKSLLHVQISSETCKLWKPKPTFAEMNKSNFRWQTQIHPVQFHFCTLIHLIISDD